ncbi:MAG: HPF/RaiA family ribosome-associated protein [Gemmatimonadaceae bacterium]
MARSKSKASRRAPMGVAANSKPRNERGRTVSEETPLALRARGVEVDDALRDYIHQRAGFKLGKYAPIIERATVRLENVSGAKGAPACRCAVKVVITRNESVVVQVVEYEHRAAFDRAIDAAERAVRRAVERVKSKARRR